MVDFTDEMVELLTTERLIRIATASRDAEPHAVVVWFIFKDNVIFFATNNDSKKFRNLKENPRIAVVADDNVWNPTKAIHIRGRIEILFPGSAEYVEIFDLLCERYPPERGYESPKSRIIKIIPERLNYWKK